MNRVKVYGEVKSGTSWLHELVRTSTNANMYSPSPNNRLGWKHGFPVSGDAIYLFIVRDIYEWTRSILVFKDSRFDGIDKPFGNREGTKYHEHWKAWNSPYHARSAKYNAYRGFMPQHKGMIIKYNYLRNNTDLIKELSRFGLEVGKIASFPDHVYNRTPGKDNPDRPKLTAEQVRYIDSVKDEDLERWVDNLTYEVYGL